MTGNETPTVVVVNDDVTQLKVLSRLLKKGGFHTQGFETAEDAISTMDPNHPPDLIVTDLYMPGIDGWRFCRLLRSPEYAPFNPIPILVVSATFAGHEASRITTDLGAAAFLPAPVDGKRFVEQARALTKGARTKGLLRVLMVEDSRTIAKLLKKTFETHGRRVDNAFTVKEGMAAIKRSLYDLAVIDYHLPDGDGDLVLADLRECQPDCVCIMMTTDPGPGLALRWMKQGGLGLPAQTLQSRVPHGTVRPGPQGKDLAAG